MSDFENEEILCTQCDGYYSEDEMYETPDGMVCEKCYESTYTTCDGCGDVFSYDNLHWDGTGHYCDSCHDHSPDYDFNGNSDYWREE